MKTTAVVQASMKAESKEEPETFGWEMGGVSQPRELSLVGSGALH